MGQLIAGFSMALAGLVAAPYDSVPHIFDWYDRDAVRFDGPGKDMISHCHLSVPPCFANWSNTHRCVDDQTQSVAGERWVVRVAGPNVASSASSSACSMRSESSVPVLQLEHPSLATQRDQLGRLVTRQGRPAKVIDVGLGHPVPQTRLRDPEILRDLADRLLPDLCELNRSLTELRRMRCRHQDSFRDSRWPPHGRCPSTGGHSSVHSTEPPPDPGARWRPRTSATARTLGTWRSPHRRRHRTPTR